MRFVLCLLCFVQGGRFNSFFIEPHTEHRVRSMLFPKLEEEAKGRGGRNAWTPLEETGEKKSSSRRPGGIRPRKVGGGGGGLRSRGGDRGGGASEAVLPSAAASSHSAFSSPPRQQTRSPAATAAAAGEPTASTEGAEEDYITPERAAGQVENRRKVVSASERRPGSQPASMPGEQTREDADSPNPSTVRLISQAPDKSQSNIPSLRGHRRCVTPD